MKKGIAMFLILLVILSLVACGEYYPTVQTVTSPTELPTMKPTTKPTEQPIVHHTTKPTTPPVIHGDPLFGKELSDFLVEEDGAYYLILPISGKKIGILYSEYAPNDLERIDITLLMAAEAKLNAQMASYNVDDHLYAAAYSGEIWLCAEVIVYLDPPNGEGVGCGIDHEHIMFEEKITK